MRYEQAQKLHCGDEVKIKATGEILVVLFTEIYKGRKVVNITCEDGYSYLHTEVK